MSDHEPGSDETYIPRPTNCWLVFRSKWYAEYLEKGGEELSMAEVSKLAATAWVQIKASNKDAEYRAEAANNSTKHQLDHPGYKYQPGKAKEAKKAAKRKAKAKLNGQVKEAHGKSESVARKGARATNSKDVVYQGSSMHPDKPRDNVASRTQTRMAVFRRAPEVHVAGTPPSYSHAQNQEASAGQNAQHQQTFHSPETHAPQQYSLPPDEFTMVDPYNPDRFALHGDSASEVAEPVNQHSELALWLSQFTNDVATSSNETMHNGYETSQAGYYYLDHPDPQSTSTAGVYYDSNGVSGYSEAGGSGSHVQNTPLMSDIYQQASLLDGPQYSTESFQPFYLPYAAGTQESMYQGPVNGGSQVDTMSSNSPFGSSTPQPSLGFDGSDGFNQYNTHTDQGDFA